MHKNENKAQIDLNKIASKYKPGHLQQLINRVQCLEGDISKKAWGAFLSRLLLEDSEDLKALLRINPHRLRISQHYSTRNVTIAWLRDNHFKLYIDHFVFDDSYKQEIVPALISSILTTGEFHSILERLNTGIDDAVRYLHALNKSMINWSDESGQLLVDNPIISRLMHILSIKESDSPSRAAELFKRMPQVYMSLSVEKCEHVVSLINDHDIDILEHIQGSEADFFRLSVDKQALAFRIISDDQRCGFYKPLVECLNHYSEHADNLLFDRGNMFSGMPQVAVSFLSLSEEQQYFVCEVLEQLSQGRLGAWKQFSDEMQESLLPAIFSAIRCAYSQEFVVINHIANLHAQHVDDGTLKKYDISLYPPGSRDFGDQAFMLPREFDDWLVEQNDAGVLRRAHGHFELVDEGRVPDLLHCSNIFDYVLASHLPDSEKDRRVAAITEKFSELEMDLFTYEVLDSANNPSKYYPYRNVLHHIGEGVHAQKLMVLRYTPSLLRAYLDRNINRENSSTYAWSFFVLKCLAGRAVSDEEYLLSRGSMSNDLPLVTFGYDDVDILENFELLPIKESGHLCLAAVMFVLTRLRALYQNQQPNEERLNRMVAYYEEKLSTIAGDCDRLRQTVDFHDILNMPTKTLSPELWEEIKKYKYIFEGCEKFDRLYQAMEPRPILAVITSVVSALLAYVSLMCLGSMYALSYVLVALFSSVALLSLHEYVVPGRLPNVLNPGKMVPYFLVSDDYVFKPAVRTASYLGKKIEDAKAFLKLI